jgi:hypothetical protein
MGENKFLTTEKGFENNVEVSKGLYLAGKLR